MTFATINSDLSYWRKQTKPLFDDLIWNIPEQKTGNITVTGGNSQNFSAIVRISEFLSRDFPLKTVTTLLPDALRSQLPPLGNLLFAPSTTSGSFAKSGELNHFFDAAQFNLLAGDLSKNSATAIALTDAISFTLRSASTAPADIGAPSTDVSSASSGAPTVHPLLITRDAVDLLAPTAGQILAHPQLFLVASMAQLQKLFRAVYYPRMIMLSQPLIPLVETLHKFTLTYPATILTFHQENILVASHGEVISTPIADTDYSPISLWSGQLAGRIAALNLFNPGKPLEATTAAILMH